ncbi:MAG: serine/threonine protein kinase, partial [Deltaproteobacteria bacterium]|nr:serine/threonine protein kinase [Deltaproteobacteria bacterium]
MPAFSPPKDPATPTGGDIFGKKTGADPATGTGAPTQRDPTQNTAQGATGGTWTGQTGGGGATQAVTTGGTPISGKPTLPEVGGHMAQYEVIRKLGEGGMGVVFLARDTRLGRRVAIKFLTSTNPELTQRFIIEARATARVEHENIVSIYEVGEWGGYPYMVLQFLQGQELGKLIPRGKQMPVPRVVEIMTPVLRALAYAHSEGIVHRDLKPDNIFVTDGGVTKVLDFGIAKV